MKEVKIEELDFNKMGSLIPAIVQDEKTKEVLMLAYVSKESLKKTLETGYTHFWSRSRRKIWMKGETSGNTQRIKKVLVDCDYDAILFVVDQKGPACHTGEKTCFHNTLKNK